VIPRVFVTCEPRDLWIGAYRDPAAGRTYVCLVPCFPIVFEKR
jgi:hypothetical protein